MTLNAFVSVKSVINNFAGEWMWAHIRKGSGRVIKTQFFKKQYQVYFGPKNLIRRKKPLKLEELVPTDDCAPATPMFFELTWRLAGLKLNARLWAMRERKRKREKARRLSRASMSATGRHAGVASIEILYIEGTSGPWACPSSRQREKMSRTDPLCPIAHAACPR